MSVRGNLRGIAQPRARCFSCGHKIDDKRLIDWSGDDEKGEFVVIKLHVECAHFMAAGMMRDVLEARLGEQTAKHWYAAHRRTPRL